MYPTFGALARAFILVGGILLLFGGLKALFTAKAEAYDRESLKVNFIAAIVMIALGILLAGYIISWMYHQFRPLFG